MPQARFGTQSGAKQTRPTLSRFDLGAGFDNRNTADKQLGQRKLSYIVSNTVDFRGVLPQSTGSFLNS